MNLIYSPTKFQNKFVCSALEGLFYFENASTTLLYLGNISVHGTSCVLALMFQFVALMRMNRVVGENNLELTHSLEQK